MVSKLEIEKFFRIFFHENQMSKYKPTGEIQQVTKFNKLVRYCFLNQLMIVNFGIILLLNFD